MKKTILMLLFVTTYLFASAQTTPKPDTVFVEIQKVLVSVMNERTGQYEQRYIYRRIKGDEIIGYLDEKKKPLDAKLVKEGW